MAGWVVNRYHTKKQANGGGGRSEGQRLTETTLPLLPTGVESLSDVSEETNEKKTINTYDVGK